MKSIPVENTWISFFSFKRGGGMVIYFVYFSMFSFVLPY